MISNLTLLYIHLRLFEIFDTIDCDDGLVKSIFFYLEIYFNYLLYTKSLPLQIYQTKKFKNFLVP